jgi:LmbE family N-acetylglucosaminyl deacetylase
MQKIMAVFAHPDDEGAVGATLARYAAQNAEIMLVSGTRGEAGEISDPALATAQNLGEVRQAELEKACRILGIKHLELLNHRDSGMDGTPQNEDPRALVQADPQEVVGQITGLIRKFRPEIVITFEPYGWYGHPDHIAISRWTTEAVSQAGDGEAYPELGKAWQPLRFYYAVLPFSKLRTMAERALAAGIIDHIDFDDEFALGQERNPEDYVTHVLDVSSFYEQKKRAMMAHETQFAKEHMFRRIPDEMMAEFFGREYFIQVYPQPAEGLNEAPAADLFDF